MSNSSNGKDLAFSILVESNNVERSYTRVWRSVIAQAISDCVSKSKSRKARSYRKKARQWIVDSDQDFHIVCLLANIAPHTVRKIFLNKMKDCCSAEEFAVIAGKVGESAKYVDETQCNEHLHDNEASYDAKDGTVFF